MGNKESFNYSTGKAILDILLDIGDNAILFETPYKHIKRLYREERGMPGPKRWRYARAIRYLERDANLKILKKHNRQFLKLTRKGKLRALLTKLERDFPRGQSWDGRWRVIVWDIPESAKSSRDKIRGLIKSLGFYQLQKSVFITPYQLPTSAVDYLRESDLLKYIRFLRVDRIDDDRELKRYFALK